MADIKYFLSCDPGLTGGLCLLEKDNPIPLLLTPVPLTKDRLVDVSVLDSLFGEAFKKLNWHKEIDMSSVFLLFEKIWPFKGQGLCSTFTFGKTTGILMGALEYIFKQKCKEVAPVTWQRYILGPVKDSKKAAIQFCRDNYPSTNLLAGPRCKVPHLGKVDSLCLAEYSKRFFKDFLENE